MSPLYRGFTIQAQHGRCFVYSGSRFIASADDESGARAVADAQHTTPLDAKFERARRWLELRQSAIRTEVDIQAGIRVDCRPVMPHASRK